MVKRTPAALAGFIKGLADGQGFDRCRIAAAVPAARAEYVNTWLASGRAGSMEYLQRHADKRVDPRRLLEGARSVIVVALRYNQRAPDNQPDGSDEDGSSRGRVAMYAWGEDYHVVIKDKLFVMVDRLRDTLNEPFDCKVCVDTAPLLEREIAAAAGIGWIGKNTMVLDHELGSFFFLGAIVTTLDLAPDGPMADHCGTCTACLDACPTSAFPAPYEMDASRCISYLTIEHRGPIPDHLQPKMDDWIFGCDICQDVCPHNRALPPSSEPRLAARLPSVRPDLAEVVEWSIDDYRRVTRGSAIKRAKLDMLKRNAAIALTNAKRAGPSNEHD